MVWQRVALKATTLRDWRSATSCRSRTSCTHPPRLRNGWMTWHSARKLHRVRWSTRRWRRVSSWCGTCKRTSWRLRQSQWSSQLHQALPSRLCQRLQDMTHTSRKPVKPSIWAWTCPVQESQCVEPRPRDGPRRGDERKDARGLASGPRSKPVHGDGERKHGCRKLMERLVWGRRRRGSSRPERELLRQHSAEVEAGV